MGALASLDKLDDSLDSTLTRQRSEADLQAEILRTFLRRDIHEEQTYGATATVHALLSWDTNRNSRANSRCNSANNSTHLSSANSSKVLPPLRRVASAPTMAPGEKPLMKAGRISRMV